MLLLRCSILALACALLWTGAAQAQTSQVVAPSPELSILLGERQIKFTPLTAYSQTRLEVFDHAGELRYDSGAVAEAALDYNLHDSNGQPLAPGLYAYTLFITVPTAETPRAQRGHFIIEKGNDQIWLTTRGDGSAGAAVTGGELTVARSAERTITGAGYIASGRTLSERARLQRDAQGRTVTEKKAGMTREDGGAPLNISGSGTTGRLTKWLDGPGEVVGDSVIHETASGDLGIGTTTPGGVLDVRRSSASPLIGRFWNTGTGPAQLRFVGGTGATSQFLITDTAEWLTSIAVNNSIGMQFRVRDTGTLNTEAQLTSSPRMTILRNGNVGIGATAPANKLTVDIGPSGPADTGITIQGNTANFGDMGLRINNTGVGGGEWYLDATNNSSGWGGGKLAFVRTPLGNFPTMVLDGSRVGIGTINPNARLDVVAGSSEFRAIRGVSTIFDTNGIEGVADNGSYANGIYGASSSGYAGYFLGRVHVNGTLSKSAGSFKIDHPLDPENKYLSHSFVESPDMMNIYNGTATTDQNGEALVEMPDYFAALNRDFRYQLTVIGQFAQAIIASKIKDNRFTIRTDKPNVEVSWQVTGVRQDAYANQHRIPIEEDKPEKERGSYLHPKVFNQPEEKGVEWKRHPEMMQRTKEEREKAQRRAAGEPAEKDKE